MEDAKEFKDILVEEEVDYNPPYNFQLTPIQEWSRRDWWEFGTIAKRTLKIWQVRDYDRSSKDKKGFKSSGFLPQDLLVFFNDLVGLNQYRFLWKDANAEGKSHTEIEYAVLNCAHKQWERSNRHYQNWTCEILCKLQLGYWNIDNEGNSKWVVLAEPVGWDVSVFTSYNSEEHAKKGVFSQAIKRCLRFYGIGSAAYTGEAGEVEESGQRHETRPAPLVDHGPGEYPPKTIEAGAERATSDDQKHIWARIKAVFNTLVPKEDKTPNAYLLILAEITGRKPDIIWRNDRWECSWMGQMSKPEYRYVKYWIERAAKEEKQKQAIWGKTMTNLSDWYMAEVQKKDEERRQQQEQK